MCPSRQSCLKVTTSIVNIRCSMESCCGSPVGRPQRLLRTLPLCRLRHWLLFLVAVVWDVVVAAVIYKAKKNKEESSRRTSLHISSVAQKHFYEGYIFDGQVAQSRRQADKQFISLVRSYLLSTRPSRMSSYSPSNSGCLFNNAFRKVVEKGIWKQVGQKREN